MRADWTASGACTSGSTALPRGATRRASGGAATTSTRSADEVVFLGVSALLFAASAAVTIVWCASMSAMGEMPMPGGWTMSMAWMRMPGQTCPGAAASFLGMWVVMMVATMLPSLVPMLWRYRQAVGRTGETRHELAERLRRMPQHGIIHDALEALAAYRKALSTSQQEPERRYLERRLPELETT